MKLMKPDNAISFPGIFRRRELEKPWGPGCRQHEESKRRVWLVKLITSTSKEKLKNINVIV